MATLLPRILGALASGLVVWLGSVLERRLGVVLDPSEKDALTGALVSGGLLVYSVVHREITKRTGNPHDHAAPPDAPR